MGGSCSVSLGYSHQDQEFSDHAAELRKQPQVVPESPHLLGAGRIKRFRRSAVVHGQDRDESRSGSGLERFLPWKAAPADLKAWAQPPAPG